jgi:hypothetical protein
VADLGPNKKRIAQLFRMLGSSGGERRNAFAALERIMQNDGVNWNDIGDVIAGGGECDSGKYTESEMQEVAQAARAEGVETGIQMGMARANSGNGNGQLTLPRPAEMAEYCHDRLYRMKDRKQCDFVGDMYVITQRRTNLSRGQLAYLASIYIQIGGRT